MKRIEIFIRQIILHLLLLFKRTKKKSTLPVIDKNSKLLFIRLNRIGDALVTTSLLYELKQQTGCKIFVLASEQNYFIFNNSQLCDEIIIYNKKIKSQKGLINKLNELDFDAVIDLHDDVSTTVSYIVALTKCEYKIGFDKSNAKIYSNLIARPDSSKYHVIDRVMEFCKAFNIKPVNSDVNIKYQPSVESINFIDNFIGKNLSNQKFILGINISAGSDARFWGIDNYKSLVKQIKEYEITPLIMCVERDLELALKISQNNIPIFYNPSFDIFAAMVSRLDFLFTPDTSIVHIASAFKVPTFGIYVKYNTNDVIWYPYKSKFDSVITLEPTLKNVKFDEVKNKFIPFFEKIYYEHKQNS
ncbi:MAG: glycosyltransferase family 9 protein [Bacteroidota bacterium]